MRKSAWSKEFKERYLARETELKWLYQELYHDSAAYERFVAMLCRARQERSRTLRRLDRARLEEPDWYQSRAMLGMQMYVGPFAGNLRGVRRKLGYLEECGVNYLHLMPLLESPAGRSDGGYAVSDFRKVQPELGTMEELAELNEDCHSRGICVCLDFVMNHTSEDHEWARRARAGEKAYQDRYFFFDDRRIPDQFEESVPQVFPTTAPGNFSFCEEAGKVVMTTFYPYQWDLNYSNPDVFNDMTENMLFLCNRGVDVIRLDAVPYIWKELGTNCRNLPQVHTLVRMMRIACEIVCPGTLLLGEVVMEPSKVAPYFGSVKRPECHLLYNVTTMATTWHTVATRDVRLLRRQLDQVFSLPKEYGFLNYLRCHDDIGWGLDYAYLRALGSEETPHKKYLNDYLTGKWPGSPARGELYNDDPRLGDARLCGTTASLCGVEAALETGDAELLDRALRLDETLHACMLCMSGIPVLYSGDEIAALNDYSYHDKPEKAADSRYLHRGDMDWDAAEKRRDGATPQGRIFNTLRRLETLRAAHRAFDAKADVWTLDLWDASILGVGRYCEGEKLIALFNFSAEPKRLSLQHEEGSFYDLLTCRGVNKRSILLPPCGFVWLLCDFTKKEDEKRRKLLFLSADGALGEEGASAFSRETAEAVRGLRQAGTKVLLCSKSCPGFLPGAGFDGVIAAAGACVWLDGEVLLDYPIGERRRKLALHLFRENGVSAALETKDACYGDEALSPHCAAHLRPMAAYAGEPVYKIAFRCAERAQLEPAMRALEGEYDFVFDAEEPGCVSGELCSRRFGPADGVRRVADALGIPQEDTYGVGDSRDAADMLRAVGTGVCTERAAAALGESCAFRCPEFADGGLKDALRSLGLTEE